MSSEILDQEALAFQDPVNLSREFETICQLQQKLGAEVHELDKEIALLQERRDEIAGPYEDCIQVHSNVIREEILAREKSYHCTHGTAVFIKGRHKTVWNAPSVVLKAGGKK